MKLLLLLSSLLITGCVSHQYEIRLFMEPDANLITGYITVEGERHNVEIHLNEEEEANER